MPHKILTFFSVFFIAVFLASFDANAAGAAIGQINSDLQGFASEIKPVLWTMTGIFSLFVAWKFITKDDHAKHYLMGLLVGMVLLKYGADFVTGFGTR